MAGKKHVARSATDRRSKINRRQIDMGPGCSGEEKRKKTEERRRDGEGRFAWERVSPWSSEPVYLDMP